jgi:hypothetical protein
MVEPLRYETIPIGQVVGPFAYVVPRDFNERRLAAFSGRDLSDCFAAEQGEFAEPSFLYGQHSWVMRKHFSWAGSVHAKCDVELEAPFARGPESASPAASPTSTNDGADSTQSSR